MRYALLLLLTGCTMNYGVQRLGDERFEVSVLAAPMAGGAGGARSRAIEDANRHCIEKGKKAEVIETTNRYVFPANSVATVTFVCR